MFHREINWQKFILIVVIAIICFTAGYFTSLLRGDASTAVSQLKVTPKDRIVSKAETNIDFKLYWQVWDILKKDYYKQPVEDLDLFYGSLRGLVSGLNDPHSVFLDPSTAEEFEKELAGNFEGIGAEIGIKSEQLTIIAPLPNTPASKASLRAGDKILAIDDFDTSFMGLDQAVRLIRGPRGTEVKLTILSAGNGGDFREVVIVRDIIMVESVYWEMLSGGKLFLITLSHFNTDTKTALHEAVIDAISKNPKGIILDLRNNPGGFLDIAVKVAGYWTGDKTVVLESLSDEGQNSYQAGIEPLLENYPTIVLVNEGSASASEIVAGALQDYELAIVMGEQTFGKGTVQNLQDLPDGSAIKLTVSEWLTPAGTSIEEAGITPDIIIELTQEDYDNDLDPQLDKAVEYLLKD